MKTPYVVLALSALALLSLTGCPGNSNNPTSPTVPSATPTSTATVTVTSTPSGTPTMTASFTPSGTPTLTATVTPTSTPTSSPTLTPSDTPTFSPTSTNTPTLTATNTPSATPTASPTSTATNTPSGTPTYTPTSTPSATPTASPTATATLVYPFLRNVAAGEISGAYYMALAGSSSVSLWVSNGSVPLTIDSFIGSDTGSYSADAQVSIGGGYAYGMAVDPSGTHLYVINNNGASNHYIEKYTLPISGAPTTWALPGTGGPGGLAVDSSYLYLSDTSGKIFKYSTAGVSITSWSGYYIPTGVAVDTVNNVLYVGDMGNHVIYKSNLDGTGLTSFATISASAVRGVAVDSSQNVFATDTTFQVVYKYNSAGTLLCTIGSGYLNFPTGLIVSPGGYLYVIEGISNQIREFAPY